MNSAAEGQARRSNKEQMEQHCGTGVVGGRVCVHVPSYNCKKFLPEALDSMLTAAVEADGRGLWTSRPQGNIDVTEVPDLSALRQYGRATHPAAGKL